MFAEGKLVNERNRSILLLSVVWRGTNTAGRWPHNMIPADWETPTSERNWSCVHKVQLRTGLLPVQRGCWTPPMRCCSITCCGLYPSIEAKLPQWSRIKHWALVLQRKPGTSQFIPMCCASPLIYKMIWVHSLFILAVELLPFSHQAWNWHHKHYEITFCLWRCCCCEKWSQLTS